MPWKSRAVPIPIFLSEPMNGSCQTSKLYSKKTL